VKLLRTIAFLAILVGLLGTTFAYPAAAQSDNITFQVRPAYDGYVKNGEWLPIWAEIENKGKDIDGQISVQITGSSAKSTYAAEISLPSGAHKRVPLYILPNNFSRELEVQFIAHTQGTQERDKLLTQAKITVRPQANLTYMIGLVAPERGGLALLNGLSLPGQERPKVIVDMGLEDIPERQEGLRSFNLLVFNDSDTSRLTPAQAEALSGWVRQGGQLVIGGGASAALTLAGLPADLSPVILNGQAELQAEALSGLVEFANPQGGAIRTSGAFVYAKATPVAQARILAGSIPLPLVVESNYGSGKVDFVSLNLSSAPFNSWPDTIRFWNQLLAPLGEYPDGLPPDISLNQMRGINMVGNIANIPALDLPSIQWLSLLLGLYIVLVGPVNYFILRKQRRMQLAWVTIPALTLLFSAGAFSIGYLLRGNDVILNQIALIYPDGKDGAAVNNYLGLFSPSQQSYSLEVKTPGLLSTISNGDFNSWGGGMLTGNANVTFIQGAQPKIKGLAIDQWSFQSFSEEEHWGQFGNLRGDLRLENEKIVGTIRNETHIPLTDSFLISGPYFVRLGDLAAGAEKQVELNLATLPSNISGQPVSFQLYEDQIQNGTNNRLIDLKRSVVSSAIDNQFFSGKFVSSNVALSAKSLTNSFTDLSVTFLGWTDQVPPEVTIDGYQIKKQVMGLVSQKMTFQPGNSDEITIPIGMIPGQMTRPPTSGGICGIQGSTAVYIESGTAEFTFQVPALSGYLPQELRLNLGVDNPQTEKPEVALFNWTEKAWTILKDPATGINRLDQPQAYINPTGSIQVRVSGTTSFKGACTYLDLGLKAKKATNSGGSDASH
jgi:hypothetical protein